jgi:autotransporter strand-loop-strand O-heptosyltransferase
VVDVGYYKPNLQLKVFYMGQELFDFNCGEIDKTNFLFYSNYILKTITFLGNVECKLQIINGLKLFAKSDKPQLLFITITDNDKNEIIHEENFISNNIYTFNRDYFINYGVSIYNVNGDKIYNYNLDLKNKKVLIKIDKGVVGNVISRIPYVEEFRIKHQCDIVCITDWHNLFIKEYSNITFVSSDTIFDVNDFFAVYNFQNNDLQQDVKKCLGLEYKEMKLNNVLEHMKEISTTNTI